ncbi:exosortase A [Pseudomonadota bacterium]
MNDQVLKEHWNRQGGLLAAFLLVLAVCYYSTYASMVSIWTRSETYTHGFIILPICAWLIWRIRDQIAATLPQANYLGVPMLLGLGLIWLFANYVGVQAAEQLAATLMIPVLVFTLLGWQATSVMAFPLAFLMFAVPIGEELTPVLINFTADFTVAMIKLVGIPVYREGAFFQLPTGDWSVVAACSGVRYLIASLTLGVLYAYLNYQSPLKRTVFITASFIVPIIANGLRAFMIVMIGHFSGMELATGVDHLVYGWVFFGIVIFIMFYIGSFWRDDDSDVTLHGVRWSLGNLLHTSAMHKLLIFAVGMLLVLWPIKYQLEQQSLDLSRVQEVAVSAPTGWTEKAASSNAWKPAYNGLDREFLSSYEDDDGNVVTLFIGYYAQQRQDAELGNFDNVLVDEDDEYWRIIHGNQLVLPGLGVDASTAIIKSYSDAYLMTYFYYVDGQWATNKYETKFLQAKARLLGGSNDGAIITIVTQHRDGDNSSVELLNEFASGALGGILSSLNNM